MIEHEDIQNKYGEYYDLYNNRYIDDYDAFICTRVIEYFFNNSQETSDRIADLVKQSLANKETVLYIDSHCDRDKPLSNKEA